jgi:hypothetical protein
MSTRQNAPRSRRAFLTAAAGAAGAAAITALDRPSLVRAGVDGDVVLGAANTSASTTSITISANASNVLEAHGVSEEAVIAATNTDVGAGVRGEATTGAGVLGVAPSGNGVEGSATTGTGVLGVSEEGSGVIGHITLSGDGVHGHSFATAGVGVRASAEAGTALAVDGKARFSRSGRVAIPGGAATVDVDLSAKGGLGGTPLCFANLVTHRPGIHVEAVRANVPSTGRIRIYLNKAVPATTYVVWLVLS